MYPPIVRMTSPTFKRWPVRVALVGVFLCSSFAGIFYGWYASFPGPNQESGALIADIWSVVSVASVMAFVISFKRPRAA